MQKPKTRHRTKSPRSTTTSPRRHKVAQNTLQSCERWHHADTNRTETKQIYAPVWHYLLEVATKKVKVAAGWVQRTPYPPMKIRATKHQRSGKNEKRKTENERTRKKNCEPQRTVDDNCRRGTTAWGDSPNKIQLVVG